MSTKTISTLEELKAFRDEVNAGNTFKGETIELANDIDLGGEEWTPIGHYQGGSFNGTFNGNGHTIKGLNIGNQSYSGGTGFFGETFTAVIKDLTIEGNINTNTNYVGGIVGHGYATITNCNFIGSIRTSLYQVGGIAGSGGFTITNCTVDGNISGASWVGGIVGNCQDGGAYTNCYVKGEISADFAFAGVGAAGIAAIPLYTSQAISNCYSDTVTKNGGKEVNAPIIGVYNDTVTADTKTFLTNNSWNKEKNSNDTFGICGGDNADPTVPVNNVSRSNNLIAVASDLLYVDPGTLTIAHGTSLTQEEILDTLNNTGDETKGAVVDPDGTIRFVNYVASINGTKYETLEAALAAAQDGDSITLLSDISLDQTLTIDKTVTIESAAGSAFTIKAGPSMTATKFNSMALLNIKNAGVSLKNLTLDGNGQSGMTLIWTNQATGLTLDTCTLQNSRNAIYAGSYNGGTVKINNCSIIAQIYAINGSGMDKIEVTDSKLYGWTSFNSANAAAEALFRNCFFGAGDDTGKNGLVAALRPYFNAVVEGCTFTEAFSKFSEGYYEENGLSLGTPNAVMDLNDCKIVTESGEASSLALAKLISTKYDAAAGNAKPNTAFAFDAVKDENGKYISGIFCGDSEVITKNLAAGLAAVANEDGTYTPTAVDMSTLLVNEKWAETYKVGDLIQEGFYFGVNAFAKANDAINAAGANATIKIQDARDYNTPITKASYTENLTIESQNNSYSQLYMTVSGKTYTYGEEDENGNAVRHDATVEYKGQDIFFGGHSHFESLAGMTVKFTNSEITHDGGTPFFKVYGDSNVVFDGANYANENGNLWFYVSGQLDLLNDSTVETEGGSGFRILAAGGKVNVDNRAFLRVLGSNISIGSYYVYGDKTAKAVVGGKKQGHDADGNNDYSATLNITNGAGLVNNGIVRVGASYILDNATTDELEGLTITDTDKPANYADLAKAYLNITNASAAELDRLYVDGNGAVTIRNSTLTANSITLADGSSLTLDTAATVTVGALTAANGTITIDASSYTSGLYKLIDVTGNAKVDYSKILTAFGENLTVIDNDLWIGAVDRSTILVDSSFAGKYNAGDAIVGREGFFYGFNAFATAKEASAYWNGTIELVPGSAADESLSSSNIELKNQNLDLTLTGKAPEHQFPFFKLDNSDSNFKSSLAVKDAEFAWSKLDIRRNATATITDSSIDFEFPSDKHLNPTIGVYYNGKVDIARSTITDGQMSITGELNLEENSTWLNYASSQIAENGIVTVSNGSKLILSKTAIGKAYEGRVNPNRDEKLAELVVDNAELATRDDAYYYEVTSFTLGDGGEYAGKITLRNGATATLGYRESMLINSNGTIDIDNAALIIPKQRTILSGSIESLAELVNNGTINVTGNSKVNIWKMSGNAVNLKDATLTDSKLGNVKVYGTNSVTDTELGNVNIGYGMDDSTESAKLSVIGNSKLGYTYVGQDNVSDSVYSLTFTTAEGQQATVDQMYIRQNGEVTVSKASNVKTSYVDLGGTLTLNEGAALENTNVNMFIRGRAEKNANGKAQLIVKDGARFNHSATGPNALLVVGGVNGDGPATASGLIYMTGEGSYFEAESVQLKDKTDATIGEIAFKLYDGATAVIRDTITVGKGTELLISGSSLGDCSVKAKNVILNGEMTISGWSELTAENITVSAGAKIWGMSGSMITVTKSLVVENYGDLYFTIGSVAGDVDVVALIKGYEGIDYTNVDVTSSEGYVKVVGNDNNLYAMRGDSSTLYANAAWTGHEMGTAVDGIAGTVYGFNAFASAETMFDNIRDTTTTLKLFGEQELVTDAATGAANNRNFNIRAKQDLTLTADEAATLTLTVKDSSWEHGGSTNNVGELAFLSDSDDAVQTITIGENVTIDTNAKIWFGRTAVTKEVHATNVIINGSIIQKPHKDATSEHPNASLYGIHQIQVEKGSTVTLNGSMLFGWSLLVKGGTFNVTENASLTWDVDAFAQTNGNVEVESRQETGGQFNVSGSKNVNLRSLTIKDSASSASFTNGAEAIFIDYITLVEGSSITVDAASTVTTGTLTNNGTITIDATGVTSGSHKVIDTDAITGTGSIIAKDGTLADDMNLVIADNDVYVTDQKQDVIYVGGVNAAGEKSANTAAPAEALQGWNKFDTMKDAFKAGALGNNTIDFGNAGRVVSDKAFIYTPETIELGKGEYTITNGAGAYLPRLTMNSRDVVVNIKKAHLTLSKYRSGKDSNGELGGASLNITDSRVDGGNEVDGLMWVTSYADSTIEITNSRVGLRDSYTGEAENVTLGNTGNYLDWGSYGNLALKVSGTALIKDSTIFAGYYFNAIGDADGATIDVTNSVVYASAVETDGTDGMASLRLNNSALRQSGWGNGSENYNFLVKKGATVSLTNGSNLWWARAAQVRVPYSGELCDSIVIDNGGKLELFYDSTAEVGNITNNGELVIYESTLKAMTITNNNYFAINNNSAITAEFSAAGTGFITVQDAAFGADTVINASASYTNQGIGSEIVMFGENLLANGANISTGWSKNLRIGFGTNFPSAAISITSGAKLTVGGSTYIGSATEDQGDAAYWVLVTGAGSEFNGSGASGDLYLRADGMLTIQNEASASFSYFNGKGVLNVLNATFKALNFNIADSGKLSIVNGAKVTLGSTTTASTARGDISVGGDETELNLIGDIKYGRTNTAANFTVKNNATVTVDGNIELGYFTQVSGVMFFYKSNLSLTNNTKFTTTETIKVFLNSAIAMDYTSRLTFGGLTAQNGAITIDVSGYTDGIYKVMENTGSNAVDYTTVISNWSEIENIGYTILDNSLYIGKADAENYLVNATYSKYKFGDAIEGKTGYFYGFNAFSSLDDAGRAAKEATKTITVEADLTEDVNTPLFDLKGDLILTAESPVTVTWNVIGNAADAPDTDGKVYLVSKDGLNHTFTIGENVTLNVPQSSWGGAFYVGYQSAWATKLNIDGKVNTYLFYIGSKSEVTISETGSLTTTSENLIMRWDSKLTVNGNGTLDENNPQVKLSYASIQGGDLVLNNTVMNAGSWLQMWNRNKVDGKQAPTLTLDNSILIASGLTANDAEEAVISLNNNSTVKINGNATNAGTMSVTDSVLYVDETLTNSGTINVYGESSIKTTYVSNTGMIILNDGTTLVDSTIMDSTENTVAYGNVTVRDSYFGTLVFSGNSGASVNGTLEGAVYVDDLMVDRRYNNAVSEDITGTLTVKADANIGVSKHMYNKVGSTTVIEANAIVTVTGELQNKGTFNVEGYLYLFSENGLGESVAGRDKNKGVMNVNGGNVYYADGPSSNGWFGIGAKIHNAGWQDVEEAGSEMNLSNNAVLDLTFNSGNEYPTKYGAAFAIGTGATLNVESGSTVNANSALLNKGTVNLDGTSSITVGNLLNEATGKINVKAGKNVSFKAGALTNNGEFAVDGGSYQGGTVKVIDLDSITGAEIIVNNIDSKYVYRGDDGDVLFSDASKEILKGNTSWSSIAFGDAVTEAGTDFYKGVNAFDNGTALWAQFEENVTTEVEIGAGDFTDGNATSASHRFIGGKNVVIRSTAAGDDYAVLSKDSTFEYGVADEATIDADYTITLEGNQQYDWLQVRAAQKDWQTGSTEAGKQIKLNADGTAQAPDHLITLNVNGKVIAKTLNVKEGTLINIDASKGGSLTGNGNGGGGYVVRGMMNVIGKNGTDFDSEATLNLNGAAFTVGYAPNSSKVRGPAFVNITDKAVVTNSMHSFLNFQAPGSILNVDNAKLDVGHIQEATDGNASYDFTFNVKNKADVHAKNSIVLGQDAQNGDDGIFSFNVENSTVAADWNIELKTFSDTTLSTSKMSAAKDFILNGNLSMQNDSTLTVGGNFTNTGSISVGSGSSLDVGNTFINRNNFNLNWNASLKMGSFDATSSSITIDMTGFDNKEHALVVVNNTTLDETAVISIVGQDFYNKYKGYLRYDGNTLYLTENLSAEVYVSSSWAGKGQGETVDYNGNTYTIGTNAFGTVEEAKAVNPLLIHIVDGTISKTALEAVKTVLEGDATYTGVITAGTRVNDGVDNRRTVNGDTNVTVNSGTFKSNLIGADSQISGAIRRNGNVTLTINGGNFEKQIAGGMYFYAQNPFDEAVLVGDVNMTINGGTFDARVYGGNFAYLDNEFSAQTKLIGDINLTINATNEITFNEHVTAGSRGTGRIYGDINVKVTGEGSKLNFTGKLIGDSNAGGFYKTASGYGEQTYVSGDRIVEFANFQGDFNAELIMFKTLNFSEGTNMTFTSVRLDVSNVSEWNFGFGTELNINAGLNSFEGDALAFGLDGWDNSSDWTAINGAKDSMIAGWDKAGSVSFFLNGSEYAASWDAAAGAWCNSELGVKLGLGDDQKSLLIGKLA